MLRIIVFRHAQEYMILSLIFSGLNMKKSISVWCVSVSRKNGSFTGLLDLSYLCIQFIEWLDGDVSIYILWDNIELSSLIFSAVILGITLIL